MANRKQITWTDEDSSRLDNLTKLTGITNDSILIRFAMKQLENTLNNKQSHTIDVEKKVEEEEEEEMEVFNGEFPIMKVGDKWFLYKFSRNRSEWKQLGELTWLKVEPPKNGIMYWDGWCNADGEQLDKTMVTMNGETYVTDPMRKTLRDKAKEKMAEILNPETGMNSRLQDFLETAPSVTIELDPKHISETGLLNRLNQQPDNWDGVDTDVEYS